MLFQVVKYIGAIDQSLRPLQAFLVTDNWDDWGFKTLFHLHVSDSTGVLHDIGAVKIASFGMGEEGGTTRLSPKFEVLDDSYFSLGQDASYYERLNEIDGALRDQVLRSLHDIVVDDELYGRASREAVTVKSFFRQVSSVTVEGQFRRLVAREARNLRYDFNYSMQGLRSSDGNDKIRFAVVPNANPPSNIHALIGSNGAGKTRILDHMSKALMLNHNGLAPYGILVLSDGSTDFASQVMVSFSAFDDLDPADLSQVSSSARLRPHEIGLKHRISTSENTQSATMSARQLEDEFANSLQVCVAASRGQRWIDTVRVLQTDPLLNEIDLESLVLESTEAVDPVKTRAKTVFGKLSSGHKIVLLTITRLVQLVEERTLVLIDEPETHLHPPLLSAYIRALSNLLTETNGVAITATHSPVVLQEIPRSCVWIIERSGDHTSARRPSLETFAENVGELTHDVFSLQVTESGYHARLKEAARTADSYETILAAFRGQIGMDGRSIARALISMHRESK